MNLTHKIAALVLSLFLLEVGHAAGEPVNEDLSLLFLLSDEMVALAKQGDSEGFTEMANAALKLTAENRNNSMILPRASAKLRAAKYAVKAGNFKEGIEAVEQAKAIMTKKKVLNWDGGSE
ncbi:conserved exported hypothetical protein [Candidatus Methylobacter favarea]|uniref:Uncharacterized protein n=1 Tax=Candidatus Methylobacter favarea TaxID=2707345 RepID=A0A8S0YA57_9GAMM|nr:hypothetical protein [Candidatus Methylobacter favarea]CAA9891141.1 conserved exported hypothetical protein [Candidatus Methylobacter favarea]